MRVRFHGPLNRVAGSCYELEHTRSGRHFLVDCGMYQGGADDDALNQKPFPFDPKSLDFVIVTHAHIDHVGLLPRLAKEGFTGSIYATRETQEIARLVLADAARQKGALYSERDVENLRWHEHGRAVF